MSYIMASNLLKYVLFKPRNFDGNDSNVYVNSHLSGPGILCSFWNTGEAKQTALLLSRDSEILLRLSTSHEPLGRNPQNRTVTGDLKGKHKSSRERRRQRKKAGNSKLKLTGHDKQAYDELLEQSRKESVNLVWKVYIQEILFILLGMAIIKIAVS